jgi:hypothetical protein
MISSNRRASYSETPTSVCARRSSGESSRNWVRRALSRNALLLPPVWKVRRNGVRRRIAASIASGGTSVWMPWTWTRSYRVRSAAQNRPGLRYQSRPAGKARNRRMT